MRYYTPSGRFSQPLRAQFYGKNALKPHSGDAAAPDRSSPRRPRNRAAAESPKTGSAATNSPRIRIRASASGSGQPTAAVRRVPSRPQTRSKKRRSIRTGSRRSTPTESTRRATRSTTGSARTAAGTGSSSATLPARRRSPASATSPGTTAMWGWRRPRT